MLVSDYNKGFVTEELLRDLDYGNVFIDTKKTNLGFLKNAWVKVNEVESMRLTSNPKNLIVTLGRRGAMYEDQVVSPPYENAGVDPCGAGDTFLAAFAYFKTEGYGVFRSVEFANEAAFVTCREVGTYAPTMEEIDEILS